MPPRALAAVAALLVLLPAAGTLAAGAEPWAVRVVGFVPGVPVERAAQLAPLVGGVVVRTDALLGFAVLAAPSGAALDLLARQPGVAYVEHARPIRTYGVEEPLQGAQYGLAAVRAPEAWSILPPSHSRVLLAVLDTGADWKHPDLAQAVWNGNGQHGVDLTTYATALQCAWETEQSGDCFYTHQPLDEVVGPMDFSGHGSHVASIAAATRDGEGMAGVSDADVLVVKVLPSGSSVWSSSDVVASGIAVATALGARVISMSLGCSCSSATMERAVQAAYAAGVVLVAAAGNEDTSAPDYPAGYPEVLSVAAVNSTLQPWRWGPGLGTNSGPTIDLAAPGEGVLGARSRWTAEFGHVWRGEGWLTMTGTSMAAPHVAGVAALMLEANPSLPNTRVVELLRASAHDLGAPGRDDTFGWGLVDAQAAVAAALGDG